MIQLRQSGAERGIMTKYVPTEDNQAALGREVLRFMFKSLCRDICHSGGFDRGSVGSMISVAAF